MTTERQRKELHRKIAETSTFKVFAMMLKDTVNKKVNRGFCNWQGEQSLISPP